MPLPWKSPVNRKIQVTRISGEGDQFKCVEAPGFVPCLPWLTLTKHWQSLLLRIHVHTLKDLCFVKLSFYCVFFHYVPSLLVWQDVASRYCTEEHERRTYLLCRNNKKSCCSKLTGFLGGALCFILLIWIVLCVVKILLTWLQINSCSVYMQNTGSFSPSWKS